MKQLLFILFTSIVVSSNNYESIYNLSSNARNAAMGGIHISYNTVSSLELRKSIEKHFIPTEEEIDQIKKILRV